MALIQKLHLEIIGAYLIDQMTHYAQLIKSLFVQVALKVKALLVHYLTIVVLLIRAGLIVALRKLGQIGTKLVTIARKILQRAKPAQKQDN
jgi:hypothetical protein